MPPLDPKAETIVAAYVSNGGDQSGAWRAGNPESKAKPATVHVEASKFFRQPKVRLRISELQSEVASKLSTGAVLTLELHMEKLRELRDRAVSLNQMSAAITAEVKRGKLMRFYVKQVESGHVNEFSHMSDEELRAYLDEAMPTLSGSSKSKKH
jgi:hypothetical protein